MKWIKFQVFTTVINALFSNSSSSRPNLFNNANFQHLIGVFLIPSKILLLLFFKSTSSLVIFYHWCYKIVYLILILSKVFSINLFIANTLFDFSGILIIGLPFNSNSVITSSSGTSIHRGKLSSLSLFLI